MKIALGLFVTLMISSSLALPARTPDDDAEFVNLPSGQQDGQQSGVESTDESDPDFNDFKGVVDTGSVYPFFSPIPYTPLSLFDNLEDMFKRVRDALFSRWSEVDGIADSIPFDPSKGNSTSVVKVINGHRVEINDTVYTNSDDNGNSIFKVRVLQLRPLESDEAGGTTDEILTDTPQTENKDAIDRTSENEVGNIDSTEFTTESHSTTEGTLETSTNLYSTHLALNENSSLHYTIDNNRNNTEDLAEEIDLYSLADASPQIEFDSINDGEKQKNAYTNRETLESSEERTETHDFSSELINSEWGSFQEDYNENFDNEIDSFASIPVDLSNDILVNDIAAIEGVTHNPEAEIFVINEPSGNNFEQHIQFEKHSAVDSNLTHSSEKPIKK